MMKRLQNIGLALFIGALMVFAGCRKDESCGLHINVLRDGVQQKNMWVVISTSPNLNPPGNSRAYPIQLNTGEKGYVECTIALPGIPVASVYDVSPQTNGAVALRSMPVRLEAGETHTYDIELNP